MGVMLAVLDAEEGLKRKIAVTLLWIVLLPLEAIWRLLARYLSFIPAARKLFLKRRRIVAVAAQLMSARVPVEYGKEVAEPTPIIVVDVNYQELM